MRKVVVYFTQSDRKEVIETDVKTWGELRDLIEGDVYNKQVVVKQTQHVLAMDAAELPSEDFHLFIFPKDSKGGLDEDQVNNMRGNNLRRKVRQLNAKGLTNIDEELDTDAQRTALINWVNREDPVSESSETAEIEPERVNVFQGDNFKETVVSRLDFICEQLHTIALKMSVNHAAANDGEVDPELEQLRDDASDILEQLRNG